MLGSALATFVKGMRIRLQAQELAVHFGWARSPPAYKLMVVWWIYDDWYGLCCVWRGLCNQKFMNEWACITIFNHSWIVEVLSCCEHYLVWYGNGSDVAGCSWWGDGTCCGIGWGWVWLGGAGARGGTRHTRHKPISIIINHKFIRPSAISMLGDFSLSQNGQPILACQQPNFHTLNKSGQCWPKHKLFSDVLVSDTTFNHQNFPKMFHIFYLADY